MHNSQKKFLSFSTNEKSESANGRGSIWDLNLPDFCDILSMQQGEYPDKYYDNTEQNAPEEDFL